MELTEPKCPECGSSTIVKNHVPKSSRIKSIRKNILVIEEQLNSTSREEDKDFLNDKITSLKKQIELINDSQYAGEDDTQIIVCISCGKIIETG